MVEVVLKEARRLRLNLEIDRGLNDRLRPSRCFVAPGEDGVQRVVLSLRMRNEPDVCGERLLEFVFGQIAALMQHAEDAMRPAQGALQACGLIGIHPPRCLR